MSLHALNFNLNQAMPTDPQDILIVDDTLENLRVLGDLLRQHGYKVRPVTSGALALKACSAQPPDLILLDIAMPGMDGFEVCAQLKGDPRLKDIPVLFISAHTEIEDKVRAFLSGGVDYITKPFNHEEVAARVSTHLALHRQKLELQANYEHIRKLEETRKNLNRLIVHDLRNPLSTAHGFIELVDRRNPLLDESSKTHLKSALGSTRQLIDMVNSLLDLNSLEEGVMKLRIEVVNLELLCKEAVANAEPLIGQRSVTVESTAENPVVQADRYLLLRIIQNLLGNALKFTDKTTGVITIRIEMGGENATIAITDNGIGIPPEYHARIFEKFVQVEGAQVPGVPSTGLGLTLVKLGMDAHRGAVTLESEPGKGTTFRLTLPRQQKAGGAISAK